MCIGVSLRNFVGKMTFIFNKFYCLQRIHDSPSKFIVRAYIPCFICCVQQRCLYQSGWRKVSAVQITISLIQLCRNSGNSGGCSRGSPKSLIGIEFVGRNLVLSVGCNVWFYSAIVCRAAAAGIYQRPIKENICCCNYILSLLVASGNISPLVAGAITAIVPV